MSTSDTPRERATHDLVSVGPKVRASTMETMRRVFGTNNAAAVFAIEVLPMIYRRSLAEIRGRLTASEANLILDVLNGGMLLQTEHPELAGQHVRLNVADAISLTRADEHHGVDGEHIRSALASMTSAQLIALELWAGEFWASESYNDPAFCSAHVALVAGEPAP